MEALFINTEAKAYQKVLTYVQRVLPLGATIVVGSFHGRAPCTRCMHVATFPMLPWRPLAPRLVAHRHQPHGRLYAVYGALGYCLTQRVETPSGNGALRKG